MNSAPGNKVQGGVVHAGGTHPLTQEPAARLVWEQRVYGTAGEHGSCSRDALSQDYGVVQKHLKS